MRPERLSLKVQAAPVPEFVGGSASPPRLLSFAGSFSFLGGKIVPTIKCWPLQPGVLGVTFRNGEPSEQFRQRAASHIAGQIARAGETLLPPDEGPGGDTYMCRYPLANGGYRYALPWERLFVGSDRVEIDLEERERWVSFWTARGLVRAPHAHEIAHELREVAAQVEAQAHLDVHGHVSRRMEALLALRRAWEASGTAAPPASPEPPPPQVEDAPPVRTKAR